MALETDRRDTEPNLTAAVRKAAVAIECFHKASLIHDDIEDGDDRRYDSPALHTEVGVPVALNAGDFLVGEGYRLLAEAGRPEAVAIAAEGHVTLSRGQGRELLWARDPQPPASLQVLDIFRQKTAAAFEVALRIGAIFGGADAATHDVLRKYSESLGIAYPDQGRHRRLQGRGRLERPRPSAPVPHSDHRPQAGRGRRPRSRRVGHPVRCG